MYIHVASGIGYFKFSMQINWWIEKSRITQIHYWVNVRRMMMSNNNLIHSYVLMYSNKRLSTLSLSIPFHKICLIVDRWQIVLHVRSPSLLCPRQHEAPQQEKCDLKCVPFENRKLVTEHFKGGCLRWCFCCLVNNTSMHH